MTSFPGAYGFALPNLEQQYPCLPSVPAAWKPWAITWESIDEHAASGMTLPVNVGGYLDFRPGGADTCVIVTDERPSPAALLHPWLSTIGALIANDRRHDTFHGGGVVVAGRAWVVLGAKTAGKSTTLAVLHQAGCTVTSDDLAVLDGDQSLSGPACIDLRQASAATLGIGDRTVIMPGRERWRVTMPPAPATVPLAGFVELRWSDAPSSVTPVPAAERLSLLYASRSALWRDDRGVRMLELASLPMLRWQRPRSFETLPDAVGRLLEHLADATQ